MLQELEQCFGIDPGRIQVGIQGLGDGHLVEAVDQLGRQCHHVQHPMPPCDLVVEVHEGTAAEADAAGGADVVSALQRRPFLEEDEACGLVREQTHVARVGLPLQGGDQARKVDEGGLERVIGDLPGGYRDRLPAVLGLGTVLHAPPLLGFHGIWLPVSLALARPFGDGWRRLGMGLLNRLGCGRRLGRRAGVIAGRRLAVAGAGAIDQL